MSSVQVCILKMSLLSPVKGTRPKCFGMCAGMHSLKGKWCQLYGVSKPLSCTLFISVQAACE